MQQYFILYCLYQCMFSGQSKIIWIILCDLDDVIQAYTKSLENPVKKYIDCNKMIEIFS